MTRKKKTHEDVSAAMVVGGADLVARMRPKPSQFTIRRAITDLRLLKMVELAEELKALMRAWFPLKPKHPAPVWGEVRDYKAQDMDGSTVARVNVELLGVSPQQVVKAGCGKLPARVRRSKKFVALWKE